MYWDLLNFNHDRYPLPTRLDFVQCGRHMVVNDDGLSADYRGAPGCGAAMAISMVPIPPQCCIFYFEVKIIDAGHNEWARHHWFLLLIGWEQGSIGYHGDDGKIYNGTGSNFVRCYEAYRDDDTVGCLINFYKNQVGFTKNGKLQGSTIQFDLTKSSGLLSAISSKSPTSSLKVNFGSRSFLFNIEGYVADQKRSFLAEIEKVPSNFPLDELTLICGYLKARGYFGTAKLLIETSHMTNIDFTSLAKEEQAVERDIFEKLSHLSIEPRAVKTSALEIALKQVICCIGHSFKVGSPEPSLIDPIISYIRIDS